MKPSEANELHRSLGLKAGDFIEVDLIGEVVSKSRRGAFRIHNTGHPGNVETALSSLHVMEANLKPTYGPEEVTAVVRGYLEAWNTTQRGGYLWLALSGNGATSRISVYHITGFRRVGGRTLGE